MPLTTKKLAHMATLWKRSLANRQQTISLICKNSDGSTTTITKPAVWRVVDDADPVLPGITSAQADVIAMFMLTDISLAQLRSVTAMYPSSPQGSEPANRYRIVSLAPRGFPVGQDRIFVTLKRQR